MPTAAQLDSMAERSDRKMKFTIKANRAMTHEIVPETIDNTITEFKAALEPLMKDNLLLGVLLQFPESFHYDDEKRIYLDKLLKLMEEVPVIFEPRYMKWQNDNVYAGLLKRNVGWCITDNPPLKNLPKLEPIITGKNSYIRFHGRNTEMWYTGNSETRYDYLYNDGELRAFVPIIRELLAKTLVVQIFFNNHSKAQAVINAKKLELLLKIRIG